MKRIITVITVFLLLLTGCAPENGAEAPESVTDELSDVFPQYFGLDKSNGLDVIVWQMDSASFSFALRSHSPAQPDFTFKELTDPSGTNVQQMKSILSSYGAGRGDVYVIPWQNPASSYLPAWCVVTGDEDTEEKKNSYIKYVYDMLFGSDIVEIKPSGDVHLYGGFLSAKTSLFELPEGEFDKDSAASGYYVFRDIEESAYENYLEKLKNDGFEIVRMKYGDFLCRNDCLISMSYHKNASPYGDYKEKSIDMIWYAKSEYAPDGGLSQTDASAVLCEQNTLSKVPLYAVDITPEGFYGRTGGQLFVHPVYSFDTYRDGGYDGMMSADNKRYTLVVDYVKNGVSRVVEMDSLAVCDDGDGKTGIFLLSYGPTSGYFSFTVTAVFDEDEFYNMFVTGGYQDLSFAEKDGAVALRSVDLSGEHIYEVVLQDFGYAKSIGLFENGEPFKVVYDTRRLPK